MTADDVLTFLKHREPGPAEAKIMLDVLAREVERLRSVNDELAARMATILAERHKPPER